MRNIIIAFSFLVIATQTIFADEAGEVIFHVTTNGYTVTIAVTQVSTDDWNWDRFNHKVIYQTTFSHSTTLSTDAIVEYGSPNSEHNGTEGVMPWGQYEIKITVGNTVITDKTVDFTDQNWTNNSDGLYPGEDTDFYIVGTSEDKREGHNR